MKRIPKTSFDEPLTQAQQMLRLAQASDEALERAAEALAAAAREFGANNVPAAAMNAGVAFQAVMDGKQRSGYLQHQLHEAFGEEE